MNDTGVNANTWGRRPHRLPDPLLLVRTEPRRRADFPDEGPRHTDADPGSRAIAFKPSVFLNEHPTDMTLSTFFSDLKPGLVQLTPVQDGYDAASLKEYVAGLPSFRSTRWATETKARGGTVIIALTQVPQWLRQPGVADGYQRPPTSLSGWSEFVEANVRFYNRQLGLDARFLLWDEPDSPSFWKGTSRDYFAMYGAFVVGARRADPTAKLGGPGVSWWGAKGQGGESQSAMLAEFLRYCKDTPASEVGLTRLPVDFIVWHQFNTDPKGDPYLYVLAVDQVRTWLRDYEYPPSTPLINGSWNTWLNYGKDPNELSPERDTPTPPPTSSPIWRPWIRLACTGQTFFNLFERWQWNGLSPLRREGEFRDRYFFGGFGLFTKDGIIKPAFNAFKALSMVEGERVMAASSDPYLTRLAARSGDKLYVLLSNFFWLRRR